MEFGDLAKVEIAFGIKTEVAGDGVLRADGSEDNGVFEEFGLIILNDPEVVFPTEEI